MTTWTWERVKRRMRPAPCASEFTCRCHDCPACCHKLPVGHGREQGGACPSPELK